jgi:hypothetical protein
VAIEAEGGDEAVAVKEALGVIERGAVAEGEGVGVALPGPWLAVDAGEALASSEALTVPLPTAEELGGREALAGPLSVAEGVARRVLRAVPVQSSDAENSEEALAALLPEAEAVLHTEALAAPLAWALALAGGEALAALLPAAEALPPMEAVGAAEPAAEAEAAWQAVAVGEAATVSEVEPLEVGDSMALIDAAVLELPRALGLPRAALTEELGVPPSPLTLREGKGEKDAGAGLGVLAPLPDAKRVADKEAKGEAEAKRDTTGLPVPTCEAEALALTAPEAECMPLALGDAVPAAGVPVSQGVPVAEIEGAGVREGAPGLALPLPLPGTPGEAVTKGGESVEALEGEAEELTEGEEDALCVAHDEAQEEGLLSALPLPLALASPLGLRWRLNEGVPLALPEALRWSEG